MKRMFAVILLLAMFITAMPVNAISEIITKDFQAGVNYLIGTDSVCMTSSFCESGILSAALPVPYYSAEPFCKWQTDSSHRLFSGELFLCASEGRLFTDTNADFAVTAQYTDSLHIFSGENEIFTTYDPASGTFRITQDEIDKTVLTLYECDKISVTGVTLNESEIHMKTGDTYTLSATVSPENADDKSVIWTSSNNNAVTVQDGLLTAVSSGSAVISVTTCDGAFQAFCTVHVKDVHTVRFYDMGGYVLSEQQVLHGESAVAPDIPEHIGYEFTGWTPSDFSCITGDTNIYSDWITSVYDITLVLNGGSCDEFPPSYTVETDDLILPVAQRRGYIFCGWYDNANFNGTPIERIKAGSHGDIILYAMWDLEQYVISFELAGGQMHGNYISSYNIESPDIYLPVPVRVGYDFMGWYDNASCTGDRIDVLARGSWGNKKYYASWQPHIYEIRYVLSGGEISGSYTTAYNIESDSIQLPTPTRTGYAFSGWYENSSYTGTPISHITTGSYGNKTYYAKWSVISYTISFSLSGGTVEGVVPATYTIESATITLPSASRTGYNFCGWYDNPSFAGFPVHEIAYGSHGDITLYARWSTVRYTISLYSNGGTISEVFPSGYDIESDTILLPTPERMAYTFCGWYDNAQYSGTPVTQITKGSYGDKTYYAKWLPTPYNILYRPCGGRITGDAVNTYNIESPVIFLPHAERVAYDFCGWYDNAQYDGTPVTQISTGSYGNKTYYAKWSPTPYSITYHTCGGVIHGEYTQVYNIESDTVTLPIPERTGYTFCGWYEFEDYSGRQISVISTGSYGPKTYYAKWSPTPYSITYHVYDGVMPDEEFAITYNIESDTVVLPRPTMEGHVFVGWYEDESFHGVPVREIPKGSYGDREFYANWRKLRYNVRFFDWDYATLLYSSYVEHGASAIPPENVPEHEGYNFAGWSADYSCVTSNLDCIAMYELKEYTVTFTDMDYTVLSEQKVRHGEAALAPEPPEHEGCVFAFWSCDFSCVTCELTVVAVYRSTTVTPPPEKGIRFVSESEFESGEEYIMVAQTEDGAYALTSLMRHEDGGLWSMSVMMDGNTITPHDSTAQIDDAVFSASPDDVGFTLISKSCGDKLTCISGDVTMCSAEEESDSFSYVYINGAYRLYDETDGMYLCFDSDEGFFKIGTLNDSCEINLYKRIKMPAYIQMNEPYFGKLYTVVAVRPDGRAYALTADNGKISGTPVEVIDGELFFYDNEDERTLAMRVAFGDNNKGFALRSASSPEYLSITADGLSMTDEMQSYWVYDRNTQSGYMSLREVNEDRYLFCDMSGNFSAENNISHSHIMIFERRPEDGKKGDSNLDGIVNTGDAVMILKHASQTVQLAPEQLITSDANGDGRVNTGDAVIVLRFAVGIIDWM